jgi:glycosyltransferase involved in cell wall biosynthesis
MGDGGAGAPRVGFACPRGAPRDPLVAALREHLGEHGWPARELERRSAAGRRLDVLHVPSAALAREWLPAAAKLRARTVVSIRPDDAAAADAEAWSGADALHVDSDAMASLASNGVRPVVIEPFADPVLLHEDPAGPDPGRPLRILSVGALSWTRGYEFTLAALRALAERGVPFECRIVGSGPHRDAVAFARHQLGLDGAVELVEPGDRDAARAHLRWAAVLVEVPVLAPSPQALLDARAAGVPVVTTADPASLTVPPRDPDALAGALARLASDAELRSRLVADGRELARAAPTPDAHGARWRDLYRELARRAPSTP